MIFTNNLGLVALLGGADGALRVSHTLLSQVAPGSARAPTNTVHETARSAPPTEARRRGRVTRWPKPPSGAVFEQIVAALQGRRRLGAARTSATPRSPARSAKTSASRPRRDSPAKHEGPAKLKAFAAGLDPDKESLAATVETIAEVVARVHELGETLKADQASTAGTSPT